MQKNLTTVVYFTNRRLLVAFDAETEAADADGSAEHHIPHVQVPTGLRRVVLFERRHVLHRKNRRLPSVQLSVSSRTARCPCTPSPPPAPNERRSRENSAAAKKFRRPAPLSSGVTGRNFFESALTFMRERVRDPGSIVVPPGPPSGASLCDATTNNRGGSGPKEPRRGRDTGHHSRRLAVNL